MALVVTPNLKLNVPEFDQIPWDEDVNTNWLVLDATIGQFAAIPDLTGVWKNNTEYMFGQSAIDPLDSSIWTCVQFHTSSAAPTTFDQERILFPARWTLTTPGAQFYAEQAQAAAADAAQSAQEAADAAAGIEGGALLRSGGTMTGPLILSHDPISLLEAASKQYVDGRVGGSGFLPLTGGTMTGALYAGSTGIGYMNIAAADRHLISFGWNGNLYAAVNGSNIGNVATQSYVSSNYLPLTGGSLSGTLTVAGEVQCATIFRLTSSGAYFYSTTAETLISMDTGAWSLRYNRSTGNLQYWRPDGVTLFNISPAGQLTAASGITALGAIDTNNYLYVRGGYIHWGAADRSRMGSDNATFTDIRMLDAYRWFLNWGNGVLAWQRYDGASIFTIDVAGSGVFSGNITAGSAIIAGTTLYASGQNMVFGAGGGGRIMQFQPNWYWNLDSNAGFSLAWVAGGGNFWVFRQDIGWATCYRGPCSGAGPYQDISDERTKVNIKPATIGLAEIRKLRPISFNRLIGTMQKLEVEIGFSAQQTRETIPEAVREMGLELPDGSGKPGSARPTLTTATTPIVAALVIAMQEMADRIEQLEAERGTATH